MKAILDFLLKLLAKAILAKYQPKIIGITGSVGKTSTKEAIFTLLSDHFRVRRNIKNYNNEIGLPLTIIGRHTGGKNIFKWFSIFFSGIKLLVFKKNNYPEILVLEMAVDRVNDMDYLLSIVTTDISVITSIGPSHLEHFGSLENILAEKSKILRPVQKSGWAVLNQDDKAVSGLVDHCQGQVVSFGFTDSAKVRVSNVQYLKHDQDFGMDFQINFADHQSNVFLSRVLGKQHVSALAAAVAVASALGMDWDEIIGQCKKYRPALGRTNLINGIKNSWIIDDTYNASPQSAKVALDILAQLPSDGKSLAVFGDMLELGKISESAHREVGKLVADLKINYLYVIGERSRDIARGAIEAGMDENNIFHFSHTKEAGLFLQDRIKENDVILVKGSRGARMEQVVYEIMARPWEAADTLVGPIE